MRSFGLPLQTNHVLATVDARLKLLAALFTLGLVLSHEGFLFPAIISAGCLLFCLRMGVGLRPLLLRFAEPLFIAGVILLLKLFFSGQDALFSLHVLGVEVTGYRDGLREGLLIAVRILGAVSVVALLGFATPFTELLAGLTWLRVPKGFIDILLFAYRSLFTLFEDAMVIYQAQKNRLGYSSLRRGLLSFGTLAGSLTIRAFDQSVSTTVAMVQRGYDGDIPTLRHKPFKAFEALASALVLLVLGALWAM